MLAELLRARQRSGQAYTVDERLRAARHLAALLLLSAKSAVHVPGAAFDPPANANDLSIAEAAERTALPAAMLRDVLATGLFTSAGERRHGFQHQTYAECLAAERLAALPTVQLRQLLCARDEGKVHVIPQLAELAAWVAGNHRQFCELLLRTEPEVLLRSDVTRLPDALKRELVAALLERAARDEFPDDGINWRFLGGLRHLGLTDQLRPVILDRNSPWNAHRFALRVAGRCKLAALSDDLFTLIRDATAPEHLRRFAADALEDVLPDERLADLEPLARGEVGPDPTDHIRASALLRLVPAHWKVRDALPWLTPSQAGYHASTYELLLVSKLPDLLELADVPSLLADTAIGYHPEQRGHLRQLADAAFAFGLDHLDDSATAAVLAARWRVWRQTYSGPLEEHSSRTSKRFEADRALRLRFVECLLNDPGTTDNDARLLSMRLELLSGPDDLRWLLEQVALAPVARRGAWCEAISWRLNPETLCPH